MEISFEMVLVGGLILIGFLIGVIIYFEILHRQERAYLLEHFKESEESWFREREMITQKFMTKNLNEYLAGLRLQHQQQQYIHTPAEELSELNKEISTENQLEIARLQEELEREKNIQLGY